MNRRIAVPVGIVIVLAVVAASWYVVTADTDTATTRGLTAGTRTIFDAENRLPLGPSRAYYSPDGSRLAVLNAGRAAVAEDGELRPVTGEGSRVVDMAWFRASDVLLIAEGPVPTGGLAVVDAATGDVKGTVKLEPSIAFGSGNGIAVAPGNRAAIVTAVTRPALATADQRFLVHVDLTTGKTTPLSDAGGDDEHGPTFVDDGRVLFTSGDGAAVLDLADRTVKVVERGSTAVGVVRGRWLAYLVGDDVVARPLDDASALGEPTTLLTLEKGTKLAALDPSGTFAVVVAVEVAPDGTRAARMRAVPIRSDLGDAG